MNVKFNVRAKQKRRNAGEGWVSYNRVLVGNATSKKNVGRNPNFDTDETKLLIQLWGDPKVQRTLITTHKKHSVICQLAAQMQEYGYYRSPEEITTRIKNLKCFYNRLKKEIEAGQNTTDPEPSWRHFAEMDAIMTRPIFSVRPNEVPQPSLKYQLEQQREQREERRKQILDEGGALSESEENIDDDLDAISKSSTQDIDDGIIPDVEVDMDINDETFAALTAAEATPISAVKKLKLTNGDVDSEADGVDDDDDDDEEQSLQIKEEDEEQANESNKSAGDGNGGEEHIGISNDAEIKTRCENEEEFITTPKVTSKKDVSAAKDNAALIIPKEEPIDVDADYDVNFDKNIKTNVGELMPTLAEMLKMTKPSTTAAISSPTATSQLVTTFTSGALTTTTSAAATATATTKISTQSTPGKISLVPASFLLQPKSKTGNNTTTTVVGKPTMQLLQSQPQAQLQQRILLSSHGVTGGTQVSNAAGIVTTGPGGMKVLLVNAEQQQQLQQQQAGSHQHQYQKMMQNQQQQQLQQQKIHQQQLQQQQNQQHQNQQQQQQIQLQQEQNAEKRKPKKKFKHQQQLRAIACSTAQKYTNNEDDVGVGARKEISAVTTRQLIRQVHDMIKENKDIQLKRLKLDTERLESERISCEIESKRLALDRERFDFERSAFERLLNVFPSILQQTQVPAPAAAAAATTMLFNPSKLLFTTAGGTATFATGGPTNFATSVPVSGATAVFAPTQNFTAGNLTAVAPMVAPQMEMCTQINELQMLTPKLEKEE